MRLVTVLDGTVSLSPHELPMLGSADAPHILVEFFDYCCPHCRETHGMLSNVLERSGDQLGIIALPAPLNRKCNPYWESDEPGFEHSCELAQLALAVWKTDRKSFTDFDRWLFESQSPRDPQEAKRYAETLVPAVALETALRDKWIDERIATNVKAIHDSNASRMPVIMSPEIDTIVGRPENELSLFELLARELPLQPSHAR